MTVRNILSALKKAGIVAIPSGTGGATIRVPLEEVSLYRICQAVEPDALDKLMGVHAAPSPLCPVGRNIGQVLERTYQRLPAANGGRISRRPGPREMTIL